MSAAVRTVGPTPQLPLQRPLQRPLAWMRWLPVAVMLCAIALAGWAWQARVTAAMAAAAPGRAIFLGEAPLTAHIAGHDNPLPTAVARCVNCHAGAQPVGGVLASAQLAQPLSRRGGPPSRYDARSLCRLLRDGIDPAWILVDRAMPRFELSDADCQHLWTYLNMAGHQAPPAHADTPAAAAGSGS